MIDGKRRLRVVDHQDARMGPASYDLVSFLLDRRLVSAYFGRIARLIVYFFLKSVVRCGLGAVDPDDFANEFRLMTIQRGLKATGTFSYQTAVCGRGTVYQHFIQPTLEIVLQAALLAGSISYLAADVERTNQLRTSWLTSVYQ